MRFRMSITPEEVNGELALELDVERVSASDFLKAAEAFIGLIKEVTKSVKDGLPKDCWEIQVQQGSQIINATHTQKITNMESSVIVNSVLEGIDALGDFAEIPEQYNEKAVEHIKTLGNLVSRSKNDIPVRVMSRDIARPLTNNTFNHASEILSWKYEDSGTVEGVLDVVSAHGGYEIRLCEPIFGRTVKCSVSESQMEEALHAFKKRVEVEGLIKYDKEGRPLSVKVRDITVFPPPEALPSYKDMRGIFGRG